MKSNGKRNEQNQMYLKLLHTLDLCVSIVSTSTVSNKCLGNFKIYQTLFRIKPVPIQSFKKCNQKQFIHCTARMGKRKKKNSDGLLENMQKLMQT